MTWKMTLSKDLANELGEAVEEIPTTMGTDIALAIVSALGPSITIATTSLFSSEVFRHALHRWCKHSQDAIHISLGTPASKISIDLDEGTAPQMAQEVAEIITKFIAIHPGGTAGSTPISH